MSNPTVVFRSLLAYALCLPLAIFLGYTLAQPLDMGTFVTVGLLFMLLTAPLFLRWYHPWLLATWNMSVVIFILPGHPNLWMAMTAIGLLIAILQYVMNRQNRIISVPAITWPLLVLVVVTLLTAKLTGGFGLRSFGSDTIGGKRYFMMLIAVMGYFVIVSRRIPVEKANLYVSLFFLGYCTMVVGSTAGLLPSGFNWLYAIFPIETMGYITNITNSIMTRSWGLATLSLGLFCAYLARHGTRGVLDFQKPHRIVILALIVFVGLYGGFRSVLIIFMLTFGILLYIDRMLQTRILPAIILSIVLAGALSTAFATHLPLSVQRSLAFLPIPIDPIAKRDAQASSEWRIKMWQNVLPQIPDHILVGKGFLFDSTEEFMFQFRSPEEGSRGSELVSDYHNGPLSVILPFGMPGVVAFFWFLAASARVMYRNYKYGIPELQHLNRFIFAYFIARIIFFIGVFGSLYSDLAMFTGLIGLSISLNGGVASPVRQEQPQLIFGDTLRRDSVPEPQPAGA